ncbi:YidC/Oxa1 family membrane protein insertase [Clostridium sp. UBA6640]|uniref:YidC/Oxa1 family membrane protein insertase n=1 Tax=Clostridium sp. UBA6640 TaxID=1946370 RepID=UPI0025C1215B|nr:YidC/Oxa1 family membrane protein insertase [Clostridium sp. UBA6640]
MSIIYNVLTDLLNCIFNLVGDFGVAIIIITVLVKLILLPMSIKQKVSMEKQRRLSEDIGRLKEKYKDNKEKLDKELQVHYKEASKSMKGCLTTLIQLPIIMGLHRVIISMPIEVGTIIIPWVYSIKSIDNYYIAPIVYALVSLVPQLLNYVGYFKLSSKVAINKASIISTAIISLLISFKMPVALIIYFITNSIFSVIEEIIFRIYMKNKATI